MNGKKNLIICAVCSALALGAGYGIGYSSANQSVPLTAAQTAFTDSSFEYWTENSQAKQVLHDFVKNALDKNSAGYIPPENRVAVFDMDGTLISETNPYYLEWMMYFYRVLEDPDYQAPEEIKKYTEEVLKPAALAGKVSDEVDAQYSIYQAKVYEGMTMDEYEKYVQDFLEKPVNGQSGITYGESFYMPMRNVVDYLQTNGFKVYVVSGADRLTTRAAVSKELGIPKDQVIASDAAIVASKQNGEDGEVYTIEAGDKIIRSSDLIIKNLKMNKVSAIAKEIGVQPVLAFGNSSGDESMLLYTINNNPYPAEAFILMCDDLERDHGNEEKAAKVKKMAEKDGFHAVSMKDDFKTIYPEKAKMTEITK
ncbi:MAG: haloacid dehalogenase-like hydrolase [Erysipelotrichaceae bacterium]|nr:haloacid dehalogenase-like hydrolase [Erysipelotrichaceae bacterium]